MQDSLPKRLPFIRTIDMNNNFYVNADIPVYSKETNTEIANLGFWDLDDSTRSAIIDNAKRILDSKNNKGTIRFELAVEIDKKALENFNDEVKKELNNVMYLGLSCIDGMLLRLFQVDCTDSYVHSITDEDGNEL